MTESATWPEENGGGGFDGVDNDDDDDDDDDGGGGYLGEGFDTEGDLDEATNGDRAQVSADFSFSHRNCVNDDGGHGRSNGMC